MPAETIGCRLLGGLGGQLWQIASTLGLAERHGLRPVLPSAWPWRAHFSIPDDLFTDEPYTVDAVELADLRSPLRPYLIDLDLIAPAEEKIRAWFTDGGRPYGGPILPEYHLAVHVRRGDYLSLPEWHPPVTADWLREAMAVTGLPVVFMFSDDPEWCRQTFPQADVIEGNPAWYDLHYMSMFATHVISNSSFSWWAAWLANRGPVVCPRNWYGPAWGLMDTSRFIPSDWKQL